MARLPRFNIPGIPQHVIQRGNNRNNCFYTHMDRKIFLSKLKEYSEKFNVAIHSYILMSNHVHLLLSPKEGDAVSCLLQSLGRYYVRYFNKTHGRTGTLWEGRFKSTLVDSDNYFLTVSRYIELNPVRANMVKHPDEYPWSSYQSNANGKSNKIITHHSCYLSLGKTDIERQKTYKKLCSENISVHTLQEIRDALNKTWILGNDRFKKIIESQTDIPLLPLKRGGDRKSDNYWMEKTD
ncbi:MAG: transposase [Gammaproteobacteria bacterium]|nr:transposase [Gammaproteobacteria bacterium]